MSETVKDIKGRRCPRCGCTLITDGKREWCTFVGGRENYGTSAQACAYGIDTAIQYIPQGATDE